MRTLSFESTSSIKESPPENQETSVEEVALDLSNDVGPTTSSAAPGRILSAASSLRRMLSWSRSSSFSVVEDPAIMARNARRMKVELERTKSSARTALEGLRFIGETAAAGNNNDELWRKVEGRFELLAEDGMLAREDFGECIGM